MTSPRTAYTFRAFFLGSLFAAFLAAGAPYSNMVLRGSYMTQDFSTPGALFLFFMLVGVFNALYKSVIPQGGLSRSEMLLIYSMMLISSAITRTITHRSTHALSPSSAKPRDASAPATASAASTLDA